MNWQHPLKAAKKIPTKSSGVYVVREKDGAICYVGESHTGRLRKTMLRHFQHWTGKTAGPRYGRRTHQVSFIRTRPENATTSQNALIAEHRPKDNTEGKPEWWEFWK